MIKRRLHDWKPDVFDQRDIVFKKYYPVRPSSLPSSVSLRARMSPVEDQGDLGSCTANAFAGNLEYLYLLKGDPFQASRLFIYFNERMLDGNTGVDVGSTLRSGIKTLARYGVCSETTVPYDISKFASTPPAIAYVEASARKITQYLRITDLNSLKRCLADGFPVVFGIPLYESFESEQVQRTGIVPIPHYRERMIGGHAMMVDGYSDLDGCVMVRNSWGPLWGDQGYCKIPYRYFSQADDMWTVRA